MTGLFLASFTALFTELLLIRWLASEIPVLGYFKNFPLLAAFIGLGVGCLLAGHPRKFWVPSLWLLGIVALATTFTETLGLDHLIFPDAQIDVWSHWFNPAASGALLLSAKNLGTIYLVLFACAFSFVGIGQAIGGWLKTAPPITAYTTDILGSLSGTLAFALGSWLRTPPAVWLGVSAVMLFMVGRRLPSRSRSVLPILLIASTAIVSLSKEWGGEDTVYWSPYYRIEVGRHVDPDTGEFRHFLLNVNRDIHQVMVDLSDWQAGSLPRDTPYWTQWTNWRVQYDFPYMIRPGARSVLIGGAGTGNNAAGALRNGAPRVTAVEIDPVIIGIGRATHPSRPYDSPRVRMVNTDIRSFLRWSDEKFDLIEYGILDSHTALSSLSSLRLDNYVYTVEGIRDAVAHLNPNGVMCISFYESRREWLGRRMYQVIEKATGRPPLCTKVGATSYFVLGPGADAARIRTEFKRIGVDDMSDFYRLPCVKPATDDWPYLYSNPAGQPWVYYVSLAFIVLTGTAFTWYALRLLGISGGMAPARLNWHMFFLGAGFLLIETKALAELSLLFGSTWVVNTFVFAGIFVMVLLANRAVSRGFGKHLQLAYFLLAASLIFWYLFPRAALSALPLALRALIGTFLVVLPLFFAGIIFATSFASTAETSIAFGSNLIGAVVGGAVEASSLAWGIRALTLLALLFYAASWLTRSRRVPVEATVS